MSKKSILGALFLICIGIVFGALIVSNFHGGVSSGFAGDPSVTLGAPSQLKNNGTDASFNKVFVNVAKAVTPSVVSINVTMKEKNKSEDMKEFFHFFGPDFKFKQPEPQAGAGSGVIINPTGYILTNNHVVEDADEDHIEVVMDNKHHMKAKLIGTDPSTDLAVIKVESSELPTASFGNSDALEVGDWVIAIGNPLGLQSTVTAGIVSAIGRNIGIVRDEQGYGIESFIQTDAAINPGNSGGPLVNLNGEVIGINSAIATTNARYQGYGFAIPINLAKAVAEDIIRYGKIRRGYIGVNIQPMDETMAKAAGLDKTTGIMVQNVVEGGAAEKAGIKVRDIILSIDDKEVNQPNELQSYIARKHPGDMVKLKIFRDGNIIDKTVSLKARNEETLAANDETNKDNAQPEREASSKSYAFDKLGFSVKELSSAAKKEAKVERGVVVDNVKQLSEGYNRGLAEGDIILEADKKELNSPKDLRNIIDKHKPGDAILLRVYKANSGNTAFTAVQIPDGKQ
jgi:serine protease Do